MESNDRTELTGRYRITDKGGERTVEIPAEIVMGSRDDYDSYLRMNYPDLIGEPVPLFS